MAENKKLTNADWIRNRIQSDEGLADFMDQLDPDADRVHYCRNDDKCIELMDMGENPTKEMCRQCLLNWLRSEAKEE